MRSSDIITNSLEKKGKSLKDDESVINITDYNFKFMNYTIQLFSSF